MNVGNTWAGLGIGGIIALLLVAGVITLIVLAFRSSRGVGLGAIVAVVVVLGAITALTLPLVMFQPAPAVSASVQEQWPHPRSDADVTETSRQETKYAAITRRQGATVENARPLDPPRKRQNYVPKMLLAAFSLAALVSLARVAVDGRRHVGFAAPTRIIATLAFVGLCVILAKLMPIL